MILATAWAFFVMLTNVPGKYVEKDGIQRTLAASIHDGSDFRSISILGKETLIQTINVNHANEQSRTRINMRRFDFINLGSVVEYSSGDLEISAVEPGDLNYVSLYNTNYYSGITLGEPTARLNNVTKMDGLPSRAMNTFSILFFPLWRPESFHELVGLSTTVVNSWEVRADEKTAQLELEVPNSITYRLTFDLAKRVCTRQEVIDSENDWTTIVQAEFSEKESRFPSRIEFVSHSPGNMQKRQLDIIQVQKDFDIDPKSVYLSYYGLPEPKFDNETANSLNWTIVIGLFVGAAVLAVWLVKVKK